MSKHTKKENRVNQICLRCGKEFKSKNKKRNRICNRCSKINSNKADLSPFNKLTKHK